MTLDQSHDAVRYLAVFHAAAARMEDENLSPMDRVTARNEAAGARVLLISMRNNGAIPEGFIIPELPAGSPEWSDAYLRTHGHIHRYPNGDEVVTIGGVQAIGEQKDRVRRALAFD